MKTSISTARPTILNLCVLSGNWQLFRRYFCSTNLVQPDGPEVTCSGAKISILGPLCLEGETTIIREETFKSSGSIAELGAGTGVGWAGILRGEESRFLHCVTFSVPLSENIVIHIAKPP